MTAADDETLPAIVLGGFCGLRTAEIGCLQWVDVDLAERVVTVGDHVAKTQSRRVVPICDAALEWLAPFAGRTGVLVAQLPHHLLHHRVPSGVSPLLQSVPNPLVRV
ncbi:MAG: site-specific integrase, partial [Verrucomicrobiae bacterium]|nr:site-specific integrase [Verrucomicrobiae bacterium]